MPRTAGIIIIGNEILSGKVHDVNSHHLAAELRALGVDLRRISVIPDDVDTIASEVALFSRSYDFAFTSGGVGPTHDDVTMLGVARAFGMGLALNARLAEFIRTKCGLGDNAASMRMAMLPDGAVLVDEDNHRFPPILVRNVYVFPGIPEYLRTKFAALRERFRGEPFRIRRVFVRDEECQIAEHLDRVNEEFPDVALGSYPKINEPDYKVLLTLESTDPARLSAASARLIALLPPACILKTEEA